MAVASYAASVQGVALRVTRLDASGIPLNGAEDVYVTRAFMRVSFTPEYEEGDEVTEKNAAGEVCVTYKSNDTLKRATMEIAVCDPDPELTELLSGGVLLKYDDTGAPPEGAPPGWGTTTYPNATVGYATVKVGDSPNPNGVGIEVWSLAIINGARDINLPYYRWVFPKAQLRPSGDRVIENGLLANTFEGWSVGNINFGTGPGDDWPWPDATDRPFLYARDYDQPWTGVNGWADYTGVTSDRGVEFGATGNDVTNLDPTVVPPATGPTVPYYYYEAENPGGAPLSRGGTGEPTAVVAGSTGTAGNGGNGGNGGTTRTATRPSGTTASTTPLPTEPEPPKSE